MKKIKRFLKKITPYFLLFIYYRVKDLKHWMFYFTNRPKWESWRYWKRKHKDYRKTRISYGEENPSNIFYIIRRHNEIEGLFSVVNYTISHLVFAEKKGWIPVVDLKNYPSNLLQSKELQGKENTWEYFYKQPAGYTLEDIEKSKNIILSEGVRTPIGCECDLNNIESVILWNRIYKKYIKYNDSVNEYINKKMYEFDIKNRRVLAVSLRRGIEWGHLNKNFGFAGYKKAPVLDEAIEKVKALMQKWKCDYVFLSIDDNEGFFAFKNAIGENLLYLDRRRGIYFKNGLPLAIEEIKNEYKKIYGSNPLNLSQKEILDREIKYLTEVHIMANSTCFYGGASTSNKIAIIINEQKYEHVLIDEGKI